MLLANVLQARSLTMTNKILPHFKKLMFLKNDGPDKDRFLVEFVEKRKKIEDRFLNLNNNL